MVLGLPIIAFGQTKEERERIASFSNKEGNAKLALELKQEEDQRKLRLSNYLAANPSVKKVIKDDASGKIEIMDVLPSGELIYAKTDNAGAATTARTTSLYSGGSLGLNIQGQGMTAGVWDGDNVRTTHQEFMLGSVSKVSNEDGNSNGAHATHVAGTISAQGILTTVRGVAFNSSVKSYDWTADLGEMLTEASNGLLTSNHSYGFGSLGSAWFYGAYDSRAKEIDQICFNNPFYQPVFSAGNSRNQTPIQNPTKGGYDLVQGHANAKNVISVAAVNEVPSYTNPLSVEMSTFSSFGPSDDGRIKPDLSMKGVQVRSTLSSTDTATGLMSGTSMASPGITGVVVLLQQYHNLLYSSFMKAQTVKGILLHTADEAGYFPGPDYEFGWGLVNAENSAKAIRDKNLVANKSIIEERNLATGSTYSKVIFATGTTPLRVSIAWTDPASPVHNSGTIDPTTKYLINDLDLKVTSSNGTIYYPWKLNGMLDPATEASNNSSNDVDNFERVDIENPIGQYTITVSHKGTLLNENQGYTLIATGGNLNTLGTGENVLSQNLQIYPNPSSDKLFIKNSNTKSATVIILDSIGRFIKKQTLEEDSLDINFLEPGNYMLIYSNKDGEKVNLKFIKK